MTRISLADLKASIPVTPGSRASESHKTDLARTDASRRVLECTEVAVATLLTVANLDRAIDGFPERIPLDLPGGRDGALAVLRGGDEVWRIDGTPAMLREMARYGLHGRTSRPIILSSVLRVLGIAPSDEAVAKLSETGSFLGTPGNLPRLVKALSQYVPPHALAASLGLGRGLFVAMGIDPDERHAQEWARGVLVTGIDVNAPPLPDLPPATVMAASRGDLDTLHALLDFGGGIEGTDKSGRTPLLAALSNGHVAVAQSLVSDGADVHAASNDGSGALHALVDGVRLGHDEDLRETIDFLVSAGCDPKSTDVLQMTAAERFLQIVDEVAGGADVFPDWNPERIDALSRSCGHLYGLTAPPSP